MAGYLLLRLINTPSENDLKKRITIILLILILTFSFAACTNVEINVGVDENNCAYIEYDIAIDKDKISAANGTNAINALAELEKHFIRNGFTTKREEYHLNVKIKRQASGYDEAFDALNEMLTDEKISIFTDVSMQKKNTGIEQGYYICLKMDYSEWIKKGAVTALPFDMEKEISEQMDNDFGNINIMLPADWAFSGEIKNAMVYAAADIIPAEQTTVEIYAGIAGDGSKRNDISAENMIKSRKIIIITLCVLTVILIAFATATMINKRRENNGTMRGKEENIQE